MGRLQSSPRSYVCTTTRRQFLVSAFCMLDLVFDVECRVFLEFVPFCISVPFNQSQFSTHVTSFSFFATSIFFHRAASQATKQSSKPKPRLSYLLVALAQFCPVRVSYSHCENCVPRSRKSISLQFEFVSISVRSFPCEI